MNPYIGHDSQLNYVEEHRLVGGKGDGMRLYQVKNGKGLDLTLSIDRCADISRLSLDGINMSYFSPCGYVAPAYYDHQGAGFLKSFTAGFLTTCGLSAVGSPCVDEGEELPLHGGISHVPAEHVWWEKDDKEIRIHATMREEGIFSHKLVLHRIICISLLENTFSIADTIENTGDVEYPAMILYHMNMGYPLLSENAQVKILSKEVTPRNARAAEGMDCWHVMEKPQKQFEEQCYYHSFEKKGLAGIYNPDIQKGLVISFDPRNLPFFTQWKMMGQRDYVLGLEPGNCTPDGRDVMRRTGKLKLLKPGESVAYFVTVKMASDYEKWNALYE